MKPSKKTTFADAVVVIASLVLLLSTLGAVGRTGRNRAKEFVCMANVRQLSLAWLAYAQDNDSRLVGGSPGRVNGQMQWVDNPSSNATGVEKQKAAIRRGLLFPYAGDVRRYHCQADLRTSTSAQGGFRSYSIVGGMNGVRVQGDWEIYPIRRYGEIESPATTCVFVEESDVRGRNIGSWILLPRTKRWADAAAIWHSRAKTTLGWADGHVEVHRWQSQELLEWFQTSCFNPPSFSFFRTPTEDEREDFDFMLRGYAYQSLM